MTGLEPRISGIDSNHTTYSAKTAIREDNFVDIDNFVDCVRFRLVSKSFTFWKRNRGKPKSI